MTGIKKIIVIGASAGGLQSIAKLISNIPQGLPAAVFVVLHVSKKSMGDIIVNHFQRSTSLKCHIPEDSEEIREGYLYVAPPDFHLFIKDNCIRLTKGPEENRWRPSIDVLFRSAAASHGSNVTGIVLTGLLDDGTSGMSAIKRCGGITIVQEPSEADFPDMPNNVLNNVDVDYRVPVNDIGYILGDIFSKPSSPPQEIPEDVKIEADITERLSVSIDNLKKLGTQTLFTCPDCGGGLWEIKNDNIHRYRCHTGHVYTENILLEKQAEALNESIWVSIRMLEERRNLLLTMASHEQDHGNYDRAEGDRQKAELMKVHIERLKAVLLAVSTNRSNASSGK